MPSSAAPLSRDARRAMARLMASQRKEQQDEDKAPAAQRKGVASPPTPESPDGAMLRGPTVERRTTGGFIRSSPVRHLWRRGQKRERTDREPLVTLEHVGAAERLQRVWNETAEGVSLASSFAISRTGSICTGQISMAVQASVNAQIAARREWLAAKEFLGTALWGAIEAVVLKGVDIAAWARSIDWDPKLATGFLVAALSRLVEFYELLAGPPRRAVIRSVEVRVWATGA